MITIKPQTGKAEAEIKGLAVKMQNLRPMFVDFQSYMQRRTTLMFSRLSRGSGSFRGVSWPWFAPQYTRADGTVVPAFGGIPKLNGKGLVKGRKRASGKRIRPADKVMQDTGRMKTAVLARQNLSGSRFVMDTPAEYAKFQHALRPFQFFEDDDAKVLTRLFRKHINR